MSEPATTMPTLAALIAAFALAAPAVAGAQQFSDPTAPETGVFVVAPAPRWELQSTIVSARRRVAVINGKILAEGQAVDGATVLRIEHGGVVLDAEGRRLHVSMFGGIQEVPPATQRDEP